MAGSRTLTMTASEQPPEDTAAFAGRGLSKHFGGVQALDGVDVTLGIGEIRAIVGENGAGKSTLMRIISGLEVPDQGSTRVYGDPIDPGPAAARAAGIALVHQELSLVPTLSVAENICLGDFPRSAGMVRNRALLREADAVMRRVHEGIDVRQEVGKLSLARRQFVEIAKALRQQPRILILDEPTASLSPTEAADLAQIVRRLAADEISVLFVSHRISEIFSLCSTATVLKDGRKVTDIELSQSSPDELVRLMVGRDLEKAAPRKAERGTDVVLRTSNLVTPVVRGVSFELHAGEILGIGGLVGAGRTELVRAVCGLDPLSEGQSEVLESGRMTGFANYRAAVRRGIAFVPEDRHSEGLALDLSVGDNLAVASLPRLGRFGLLRHKSLREFAVDVIKRYDIRPPLARQAVRFLSGGNQQKVVLAKWLLQPLRVLILDEPTRGVDVGAKAQLHDLLRAAADQGVGVLVVSSDLPELLALSDRILVMRDGRVSGELSASEASEEAVIELATP